MTKLSPKAHDRLLNLLYEKTVPHVNTQVNIVKKVLYEEGLPDTTRSALDELMDKEWGQRPMEAAVKDVADRLQISKQSSILRLDCRDAFIGRKDLHNLFPINRERQYSLPQSLRNGLNFHVVKARNPITLLCTGAYYLSFPNHNQACVYYQETKGKVINGLPMTLEFIHPTDNHLRKMSSPLLHGVVPELLVHTREQSTLKEIFSDPKLLDMIQTIGQVQDLQESYMGEVQNPLYSRLASYMAVPTRYSLVLVQNLPFGVSAPTIENLLWNYEFATPENPHKSIFRLQADAVNQVSVALLRFADERNARRFVRNYHGRRWENMLSRKVKTLYEQIFCEILD